MLVEGLVARSSVVIVPDRRPLPGLPTAVAVALRRR